MASKKISLHDGRQEENENVYIDIVSQTEHLVKCPRCEDLKQEPDGKNNFVLCPYYKQSICEKHCYHECKYFDNNTNKCLYRRRLTVKDAIQRLRGTK